MLFVYKEEYSPGVSLNEIHHPYILRGSNLINESVSFDSNVVIIRRQFMGEDIKAPLVLTFDDYLEQLSKAKTSEVFTTIVSEKFTGVIEDELTQLFEKFTDITIPLPFTSETIFGPPTINLRITGAIDITASYENVSREQTVSSLSSNSQNNINFKQEVLVTAKGKVGDKLSIDADWNTQRVFDFENQLKIKYEGYADEVIKRIEAGNVSLQTNSGLIQSTQALFGIKGEFQLGPLTLTTVVSQKKSKQEEKDFTGGVQDQTFTINVFDYSDNHFLLDTIYKSSFLDYYNSTNIGQYQPQTVLNRVLGDDPDFEVWVQTDVTVVDYRYAAGYIMLGPQPQGGYPDSLKTPQDTPGMNFAGYFRKLSPSEYYFNEIAGYLSLRINIPQNFHIGVVYKTQDNQFGTPSRLVASEDTMLIKLVKTNVTNPDMAPLAWELKLKNIYRLPISKVIKENFELKVNYNDNNQYKPNIPNVSTPLLQIVKLDRFQENSRVGPPDDKFDFLPGYTINTETGDIIFPSLRPFFDDLKEANVDSTLWFKEIYTQSKNVASTSSNANTYIIQGKGKGEAGISNVINLGFNVVPGSVKVLIGTTELVNNIDYSVDYSTGTVMIKNAAALISKDLKIRYETNELFSLASKTLIGARGDYKVNDKTSIGFTFLNLKQETLNDKVRIGEEPTNNSMIGIDFVTEFKPKLLTNIVNMLPGYNTKEESAVTLKGEFAYMIPDPNTKRSRIPQDNNEPVAYVDDMEGAKKIVSLGTNYSTWTLASAPADTSIGDTITVRSNNRGRFIWYNNPNQQVSIKDIFPARDVQPGQDMITPLYVQFNPNKRGRYNYSSNYTTQTGVFNQSVNRRQVWGGMMKFLNTTSTDLLNENINFIEFNMRIETSNPSALKNGKLVIDLGTISEDVIPNGKLDTEDSLRNGILRNEFDIGLDFFVDERELEYYNSINGTSLSLSDFESGDPALDNNDPTGTTANQGIYDLINGTQFNAIYEGGNRPDTEDLNRNGRSDLSNSYFKYEISLDTTANRYISGTGKEGTGWFQYSIPLSEFVEKVGQADLRNIEYARVWIAGVEDSLRLAFVDFNLVGNQWFKPDRSDTSYTISVVSIEENPQIYQSPVPGNVLRQEIQNTTGVNTLSNESSLSIGVSNLVNGERKLAIKDFRTQTLDLFNYKMLKLFVNGDPTFNYTSEDVYDATMLIRLGSDSNNYYEYRAPVRPDVRPGQPWNQYNEVTINFADLTALKSARDSISQVIDMPVPGGPPGSVYRIKGNPALNSIREIVLGVEKNRTSVNTSISGSVWFNEIRVLNVDDDNGYAFNINAGVKFADLMTLNFNYSKTSPNFFRIDERFGTRRTGQSWDVNGTINLHKFINNTFSSLFSEDWSKFINLPLTFRHSEILSKPKFYPGTDINLDKAVEERYKSLLQETGNEEYARFESEKLRIEAQSLEIRNELSIQGMQFNFPSNNYIVKTFLNRFLFNFSANFGHSRDVIFERRENFDVRGGIDFTTDFGLTDILNLNIGELINLGEDYKEGKIYLALPFIPLAPLFSKNFNAVTDFNRTRDEKRQRQLDFDDPTSRIFKANRGFSFDWKFIEDWLVDLTGTYRVTIGSDLTPFETIGDSILIQRPTSEVLDDIFFNNALVNFGRDLDYAQTTTFNPRFNLPFLNKFMDLNLSYNVTYGWRNPNSTENIGYNVGYNNTVTAGANLNLKEIFNIFSSEPSKLRAGSTMDDREGQNIGDIFKILSSFLPTSINATFRQTNTISNPGVIGRPGFGNFWFEFSHEPNLGPSRLYQLGLSQYPGERAPNLSITDNMNLLNDLSLSSTITPISDNIKMNLTFKKKWGFDKTNTFNTDEFGGYSTQTNKATNIERSNTVFFGANVDDFRFEPTGNSSEDIKNLSSKFRNELSSFPFPNWTLSVTGVEKFAFFEQFASSVTIENSFVSEYSERISVNRFDVESPSTQIVRNSFSPLFGINVTFKEAFGGNLSANLRYNITKENRLEPSTNLIRTTNNSDWSLNVNFSKAGFEIPLFGLSLKNDITFALTISRNVTNPIDYRFITGGSIPEKLEGNGSSITTINPSIQYSLSQRVQMQLFFKNVKTEPTSGNASTVPNTSNEGGLNIRIAIQ
jgi:cell surface protein SprA